jgi:hypothetical protein
MSPNKEKTMHTKDSMGIIHHVNSILARSVFDAAETEITLISENCAWTADHEGHDLRPNETSADAE